MTKNTIRIHTANVNLDTELRAMFKGWYISSTSSQEILPIETKLTFTSDANFHDRAYLHIHYNLNKDGYCCGVQLFVAHPKLVDTLSFRLSYKLNVIYEMSTHPYMEYIREVNYTRGLTGETLAALRQYIRDHPADYVEQNAGYIAILRAGREVVK
jgi:hypothetical protein